MIYGLLSTQASAYELTLPGRVQPIRDRPYHISADTCGPAITAEIERAVAIWNFYSPARLLRVKGPLPARPARYLSVMCQDGEFFEGVLGEVATLDGMTHWRYQDWQFRSADIIFNTSFYVPRHCSRLHEIGHALGLGHSDNPKAAMGPDSDCEYLTADDLLGIAAVFGVAPNCTPYVSEDLTVHFPAINGEWLELRPVVPGSVARGFYEAARGQALGSGWQCDLAATSTEIRATVYYRGTTLKARLERVGQVWIVR